MSSSVMAGNVSHDSHLPRIWHFATPNQSGAAAVRASRLVNGRK
ncbi:hypothetical protein [Actinacidiphila rubida]|nr:hypothetical protein [Actinacidiphila rubida]